MPETEAALSEKEARKHVRALRDFYTHALIFLVVNVFLIGLNLMTTPEYLWISWSLLGWGMGLAGHAVQVYGMPRFGRAWEERKVREMTRERVSLSEVEGVVSRRLAARPPEPADAETARLRQRIEHLEAIVTSRDWDLLDADFRADEPTTPDDRAGDGEASAERAADLARRVR